MKLHSTAKNTINEYIKANDLDKKEIYGKLMPIYNDLVRKMENNFDYGGLENTMAGSNISIMAGLFALWDVSERKLTVDDMLALIDRAVPQKIPVITHFFRNHFSFASGMINRMYGSLSKKVAMHKAKGEWKDAWGIEIKPIGKSKESLSFDLIGCPIVAFAKKYGYEEIMPALCRSDYITIRQLGAKLIRPQIVADGYERCTFTYVPDKDYKTDKT